MLEKFSPKLMGMDALVNIGTFKISGLPRSFLGNDSW